MSRPVIARPRRTVGLVVALALALATGCSKAHDATPAPSPSPSTTAPSPTPSPAQALAALAARGLAADWTATYRLVPTGSEPVSNVTVFRTGTSFRIDIVEPAATTMFMTAAEGYVSCRVEGSRRACLLVGPLDKPVPKVFDPGLHRIVTSDLAALAAGSTSLAVTRTTVLSEDETLPRAECFQVTGTGIDEGEYCLTAAGLPRRVSYPTGTMDMTSVTGAPNPQVFTPPVTPTPVPSTPTPASTTTP